MTTAISRALRVLVPLVVLVTATFASTGVSMAQTTLPIPLTTFKVGTTTEGPVVIPSNVTDAMITLSRTAGTHSLNSAPSSTTMLIEIQSSFDGGTTWVTMCSSLAQGGFVPDDQGNAATTQDLECTFPSEGSTNRAARAKVTVSGSQISTSGTLTLT